MLGVQTARGSEPVADRADRKGGAAQHPEGGIAERRDALGVKVMAKHATKNLPDLVDGELPLPDATANPERSCEADSVRASNPQAARICH
jgi:hypothetical protein